MLEAFTFPITWRELLTRTVRETIDDDCMGMAAQLAYYFFLALSPAILFLLAIASFFPLDNVTDDIARVIGPFVSSEVLTLLQREMQRLSDNDNAGLLTFGVVAAMWSSSAALVGIVSSINKAYDLEEQRPWWRVRLLAMGLTLTLALLVLTSLSLILAGPSLATYLGRTVGLGAIFEWTWKVVQWPVAFFLVSTGIGVVYYFAPNQTSRWVWVSPGAVFATALWLIASLAFKFYVTTIGDYQASYGAIGGIIVLLLWFYVSGVALLVGAELNSEIAHAAARAPSAGTPAGAQAPGEGERSPEPLVTGTVQPQGGGAWRAAGAALAVVVAASRYARRRRDGNAPVRGRTA